MTTTPKYAIVKVVANANWYGAFKSSTIINVEVRKTKKSTGLLADTLYFPVDLFCDVDRKTKKYIANAEFKNSGIMLNNGNVGSFSRYFENIPGMKQKIIKTLKGAGYQVIVKKEVIEKISEQDKKVNQLLSKIFN